MSCFVCIDLDETVFSFRSAYIKYHNKKYGTKLQVRNWITEPYPPGVSAHDFNETHQEFIIDGKYKTLRALPKAKEALNELYEAGYLVNFVTIRPESVSKDTEAALDKIMNKRDYQLVMVDGKADLLKRTASGFALVVDDNYDFAMASHEGKCPKTAMIRTPLNVNKPTPEDKTFRRVKSLRAAVNWLLQEEGESEEFKKYREAVMGDLDRMEKV